MRYKRCNICGKPNEMVPEGKPGVADHVRCAELKVSIDHAERTGDREYAEELREILEGL